MLWTYMSEALEKQEYEVPNSHAHIFFLFLFLANLLSTIGRSINALSL